MSFQLLDLTAFLMVFFGAAVIAAVVSVATITTYFTRNRAIRLRRDESVRRYYGRTLLGA
jgi:hypothetical protein